MTKINHPALLQAENEKLRGLLSEVAHCLRTSDEQPLYWEEEFASRIYRALSQQAEPVDTVSSGEFGDAYQGAREDLAFWKRQALEAEQEVRHQEQIIEHLFNEFQGETRFGEPVIPKVEPAPAQDEREAPVVVATAILGGIYHGGSGPELGEIDIEVCMPALEALQCKTVNSSDDVFLPLMSVAQHERIVAALTRPAQTEQQPAYVECRECTDCGHVGINDAHQTDATCAMCDWSGPSPVEDKCPDCGNENAMGAACPKCSGRYRILAETHVAAPIAQTALTTQGAVEQ